MIGSVLLARVTPAHEPIDTTAMVTIGQSRGRVLWHLLGAVTMTIGAAYGLVTGALIAADRSGQRGEFHLDGLKGFIDAYSVKTVAEVFGAAERTHALTFHAWPAYAFGITTLVLAIGLLSMLRLFMRLQSAEPSIVVGPPASVCCTTPADAA